MPAHIEYTPAHISFTSAHIACTPVHIACKVKIKVTQPHVELGLSLAILAIKGKLFYETPGMLCHSFKLK